MLRVFLIVTEKAVGGITKIIAPYILEQFDFEKSIMELINSKVSLGEKSSNCEYSGKKIVKGKFHRFLNNEEEIHLKLESENAECITVMLRFKNSEIYKKINKELFSDSLAKEKSIIIAGEWKSIEKNRYFRDVLSRKQLRILK